MKLVENWRSAYRWLSIQIAVLGVAAQGAVLAFPDIKNWLGDTATHLVGILILFGIVGARLKDQKKPEAQE